MSSSEFDAHVYRAHDLIVVDVVIGRSVLNRIARRSIGGKAAPIVVIDCRIVGVCTLNIVVVDFSRAARCASGIVQADVFIHQALVGIVNDFIPGYP